MRNNPICKYNYPTRASQWNTYSNYPASIGNPYVMSPQRPYPQLFPQKNTLNYHPAYQPLFPAASSNIVAAPSLPFPPVYSYTVPQVVNSPLYQAHFDNSNNLEKILIAILILVSLDLIVVRPAKEQQLILSMKE
ncbi:MAG: hypothetical protein AWM53_01176 [Candidatus Dichloromethanomonas elyunquensis]|nr:MAG: hypothetical protein AWM53_01176 [Candidatus Dichloromethanomonas elyunquensis]